MLFLGFRQAQARGGPGTLAVWRLLRNAVQASGISALMQPPPRIRAYSRSRGFLKPLFLGFEQTHRHLCPNAIFGLPPGPSARRPRDACRLEALAERGSSVGDICFNAAAPEDTGIFPEPRFLKTPFSGIRADSSTSVSKCYFWASARPKREAAPGRLPSGGSCGTRFKRRGY